jgi:hypothetical protein
MVKMRHQGQATVEAALGLLVFITVLVFGLHFAEVGYLSLKVTEANASALWDATAAKMHHLPGDFRPVRELIAQDKPGRAATQRYQDFDGRTSKSKDGGEPVRLVFTQASDLRVSCDQGPSSVDRRPSFAPAPRTQRVYEDTGSMRCRSQATMVVLDVFPKSFLDSGPGALFQERHLNPLKMTLCGTGRAQEGACQRGFSILLDDWGLATKEEDELEECNVLDGARCRNKPYYRSVKAVYDEHLPDLWAARTLASKVVGGTPQGFDPATFYMSFRVFQETEPGGDADPNNWMTTPGNGSPTPEYHTSYERRGACFLGQKCPP